MSRSSSFLAGSPAAAAAAGRRKTRDQQEAPPSELLFSNQTGAVARCGVAHELARSMARAERQLAAKLQAQPTNRDDPPHASLLQKYDIRIRWQKADTFPGAGQQHPHPHHQHFGDHQQQQQQQLEIEQTVYGGGGSSAAAQQLRFVRKSDQALVFEPFRALDFRPDIHAATYRCTASSSLTGASVVSRDMRVRAIVPAPIVSLSSSSSPSSGSEGQQTIQVLDEMVVEGNSALFRCQVPSSARDYLQVLDWIESPSEQTLTYQGTTLASASLLFRPVNSSSSSSSSAMISADQVKYLIAPKSGDLHILNVRPSAHYRSYRCRCKNRLTGEVISSSNKGKLIVSGKLSFSGNFHPLELSLVGQLIVGAPATATTESHSQLAPRLILDASPGQLVQLVHEEGQLALLNCNTQSFSRWSKFSWSRKLPNGDQSSVGLPVQSDKYAQLANLLLINQLDRNDSGVYVCRVKNSAGEEQLELELALRGEFELLFVCPPERCGPQLTTT